MNITERITNDLQEAYAKLVLENREIQFYYQNEYLWRDARFWRTRNEWNNPRFTDDTQLLSCVRRHLDESLNWKKEVYANCDFKLTTTCPYCNEDIDLLDTDKGYDYTRIVFGDWDSVMDDVECHKCEKTFTVSGVQR